MAVTGHYMAGRVRRAQAYVTAYGECVLQNVLPVFANLDERADEIASAEFARLGAELGEDRDGDMGEIAETAHEKGQAFYDTMVTLRQTTINLYAAGLFHLLEQQLADLCHDGAFRVPPPKETKLEVVASWYRRHFAVDFLTLSTWSAIDELRLVANVVKHGEGGSARNLRERRPGLFQHQALRELLLDTWLSNVRLRSPLAGEDLHLTEETFQEYSRATERFIEGVVNHFETHGDEDYPHAG